jgi:coenzyme F420-reducing hydrogenase delta subunit
MLNDIKTDNFCKNKTDFIKTLIDIVKSKNNKERLEKIYTLIEHKKITEYINEYIQRIKNYRELKNQYSA